MGLDMYLTAERYYWDSEAKPAIPDIPAGYEPKTVTVEAAYWRKANQIHAWFVDNVQNGEDECREHYVSREMLTELRNLCAKTLKAKTTEAAMENLPPRLGFFFGSDKIDEWYWRDLESTVEQIDKALAAFPEVQWGFNYRSSW